ncbi:hypothetical protein [Lachnobacterium bovis]|uniref:Uncharacterized protein n=1 Tax=Lachnobacterium bovis TaxID=140626 RepID=A0A1H9V3C0_9FIRM|nr:hypothetical protein [Lachnobacterium bovis]SES15793.1 hypothetical protein SAMN02910429_02365 [Lachnobacterium bovis]
MILSYDDDYASKMGKNAVAFIPEVTISESEIAELEKPKVKEVKPKDVEKIGTASKAGKITEGASKVKKPAKKANVHSNPHQHVFRYDFDNRYWYRSDPEILN